MERQTDKKVEQQVIVKHRSKQSRFKKIDMRKGNMCNCAWASREVVLRGIE
jgi:hypothetical protein